MSFDPSMNYYSQSTTEPNTPEPPAIDTENEELPSGDFARLTPISRLARIAFHGLVLAMKESPQKYYWHRKFVYFRPEQEELEAEADDQSTSDEHVPSPKAQIPSMVHTGFWRLNMNISPATRSFGWVLGKGRWNTSINHVTAGVDILLTADMKELALRGRHARFIHSLESYAFMIAADKTLRVGSEHLKPTNVSVLGQRKTAIAFGDLEYELAFMNLDSSIYRAQIDQIANLLKYQGHQPGIIMDPTPAETDYLLMDKYIIRKSFMRGSTCWLCSAVVRATGALIAVKKVVSTSPSLMNLVTCEINALKRLSLCGPPASVAKLIDSIVIESSSRSGASECFIISQPLIRTTLAQLLLSPSLSMPSRLSLFEQMLEGLAFLHQQGCIHRDIKPENILASESPLQAVIIDFGCATWDETSNDHMQGTIRYLAPEIIALKDETAPPDTTYDRSADVWGMGLTAWELMQGFRSKFTKISRNFYDGDLLPAIKSSYAKENPEEWASSIIGQMLQWKPKLRITAEQAYQRCPSSHAVREKRQLQPGKRERGT